MKNKYCKKADLRNESDVEQSFVRRLIEDLGYSDAEIRSKETLSKLTVGGLRGMSQQLYRPDFAIKVINKILWIVEAKSPNEALDKHFWQPTAYCRLLNGEYRGENPTEYFLLTNGLQTRLFKWDENDPTLTLNFEDFEIGNKKFERFQLLLHRKNIRTGSEIHKEKFQLFKASLKEINAVFAWCHQHIYRKDNIGQAEAFSEFVKLISLKLISDRTIKEKFPGILAEDLIEVPKNEVKFSLHWIEQQKGNTGNPIDKIQFREFLEVMEKDIAVGKRKRIFEKEDSIKLKPETIEGVVKKLESIFLFGVDADLNGRLFETFLNATMRGKDLGQFFTPRSLVKLGVRLAQPKIYVPKGDGTFHTDVVMDACSGTGGFLIDILAHLWKKIEQLNSLSRQEKDKLKFKVANEHLLGIDISSGPNLARVARLNMYLHGDGGTRIFHVDALDKDIADLESDGIETLLEKKQLRDLLGKDDLVDIVLTNPPFAKVYDRNTESEAKILDKYEIGFNESGVARNTVKSSLLFIERYYDILKPGGKLITIIDDGILSGKDYKWFRAFIRQKFIIRAVISLPGDAFQRSKARVKTSFLVAEKKVQASDEQSPVFMYACKYVGIDDPSRQRALPIDEVNREKAAEEIEDLMTQLTKFQRGVGDEKFIVSSERLIDRLDVKNCLMKPGRSLEKWKQKGFKLFKIEDILEEKQFLPKQIIETKNSDDYVTLLVVRYSGNAEAGDEILASDSKYSKLYLVSTGDIVISNIAASHGSIAVVPDHLDGCAVSTEYTVLRAKATYHPIVIHLILRSPEIRADILLSSTGINRTRMRWELIKEIYLPYPDKTIEQEVINKIHLAEEARRTSIAAFKEGVSIIEDYFDLSNRDAKDVLAAFKPPK